MRPLVVPRVVALGLAALVLLPPAARAEPARSPAAPTPSPAVPAPVPSDLEGLSSASRDDLVRALRKIRRKYGEHAVQIETHLLVNAMRTGSVRATAVRVEGVQPYRDRTYLGFDVETGLVFDSATRDERARIQMLWTTILLPTLERLQNLEVPADGIRVALRYHHRPYHSQAELHATIDEPGTPEETRFYVLTRDVYALLAHEVTGPALIGRSAVTVDGGARELAAVDEHAPTAPGPD